jgi:membrane associated rhomboid family serine protease
MLLLTSIAIPHELIETPSKWAIVVPAEDRERALYQLQQYEQENPPPRPRKPVASLDDHNPLPGVLAYVGVICLVAWLAGNGAFGIDWLAAGRVDGALIRNGEWWRALTALTLHGSYRHLLGNIGFGVLFGLLAGRIIGPGVAWFAIVAASGFGNLLNTVLLESAHRSIGASTAVFAALGLLAGFVWRGRLMKQDRWPYRIGPVVGGIALLAYTGTGDENTDIGAHLAGFACGFLAGIVLTRFAPAFASGRLQTICGLAAALLMASAWLIALQGWY